MKRLAHVLLGLLLVSGLTLAAFVALNWAPDRPLDELKARWAPPPSQFVDVGGMSVHLRDQGRRDDPEPILLLHGTSASLHTWEGWVKELAPRRRVISVDLPGFGLTGPFADGDYHVEHYTAFLLALLDHLRVKRVVLVGNSFGGQLAWRFALAHPERSARLVLVDAAGYPRNAESVPIGFRLAGIPALAPLMSRLLPRSMIEARSPPPSLLALVCGWIAVKFDSRKRVRGVSPSLPLLSISMKVSPWPGRWISSAQSTSRRAPASTSMLSSSAPVAM